MGFKIVPKKLKPKMFKTEADLCAAFIASIDSRWTPYAETAGWDILLVRHADGFQIGIQAKQKMNTEVVNRNKPYERPSLLSLAAPEKDDFDAYDGEETAGRTSQ